MSFETIPCPHCHGTGQLLTKTAEDLVPSDVLLPTEPGERPLTLRTVSSDVENRLTLAGTDDQGEEVRYHGVPWTQRFPVARKIPDPPQESP